MLITNEMKAKYDEMVDVEFRCKVKHASKRYYNEDSNYGIFVVQLDRESLQDIDIHDIPRDWDDLISVKGVMMNLSEDKQYRATLSLNERDDKWGYSYSVVTIVEDITLDLTKQEQQRAFLEQIFTPSQVKNMYDCLVNPFVAFMEQRMDELVQVKGCKLRTVEKWLDKFNDTIPMLKLYTELPEYSFTYSQMKHIIEKYHGADLAVAKIKENPYCLLDVDGLGWKKVDKIVLANNPDLYNKNRVKAFITYYLNSCGSDGNSYISGQELMDAMIENLGEELPDMTIVECIRELEEKQKIWVSADRKSIGNIYFYKLACHIAEEIKRIQSSKNDFIFDNWEDTLKRMESLQGWEYTSEQRQGIKTALEKNFSIIIGSAGTGKSSVVAGVLEILRNYSCITVALAGKAASHTALISGGIGATIHTLLEYPTGDKKHQLFARNEENPVEYDIIIVDEISMIGASLWYYLLRAIADGTKVILLGDTGQLEAIGEGAVARDLIESGIIPVTELTEIHRQAKKSGIITESLKIRKGTQIVAKDCMTSFECGELKDLLFDCYCDKSQTFYKIMQHFTEELPLVDNNIMDLQIIVPIKNRGDACTWKINQTVQELYNPKSSDKAELEVNYQATGVGILRVGDKVICVKNNRKLSNPYTEKITPIFNGNIGVIREINIYDKSMIVEFETGVVRVPKKDLSTIELAYAITVHKEQGSSAKRIIFGVDFSSYSLLTKQLLYTALTRAEKHCTVCCESNAFRTAISKDGVSRRSTHLGGVLVPPKTTDKKGLGF